jgi:hypothetical protein
MPVKATDLLLINYLELLKSVINIRFVSSIFEKGCSLVCPKL